MNVQSCKENSLYFVIWTMLNRGNGFEALQISGANKDGEIHVGRSTTVDKLSFCVHTHCMSYVTKTFLLVSFSVSSK